MTLDPSFCRGCWDVIASEAKRSRCLHAQYDVSDLLDLKNQPKARSQRCRRCSMRATPAITRN
jgi:hypothetical protein